jgi:hypothetical protein
LNCSWHGAYRPVWGMSAADFGSVFIEHPALFSTRQKRLEPFEQQPT